MPARARSLEITDRYRAGMIRLRRKGQREAKRIWNQVSAKDLDGTFPAGQLELTVSTLQKEAARLSSAYLATFMASETGDPIRPPALEVWDKAFGGGDLREGLRSAVVSTKEKIADGQDPTGAIRSSRAMLVTTVGLFIDTAARESLRQGMEADDRIVGYQRAVKGTCEACLGAADGSTLPAGTPLDIHPNCDCVAEPVVNREVGRLPTKDELGLSPSAAQALTDYRNVGYTRINQMLRGLGKPVGEGEFDSHWVPALRGMEQAFERAVPLKESATAWRGVRVNLEDAFPSLRGQDLIGKVIEDPGYTSTAVRQSTAEPFARIAGTESERFGDVWRIVLSKGEKVIDMGTRSLRGESEILLDKGRCFKIVGVHRDPRGYRVIEMEVLR